MFINNDACASPAPRTTADNPQAGHSPTAADPGPPGLTNYADRYTHAHTASRKSPHAQTTRAAAAHGHPARLHRCPTAPTHAGRARARGCALARHHRPLPMAENGRKRPSRRPAGGLGAAPSARRGGG